MSQIRNFFLLVVFVVACLLGADQASAVQNKSLKLECHSQEMTMINPFEIVNFDDVLLFEIIMFSGEQDGQSYDGKLIVNGIDSAWYGLMGSKYGLGDIGTYNDDKFQASLKYELQFETGKHTVERHIEINRITGEFTFGMRYPKTLPNGRTFYVTGKCREARHAF